MSPTQEKKCQKEKLDILYYELYNLESENAYSVKLILEKEKDKKALGIELDKAQEEFKQVEAKIEKESNGKKNKKLSEDQKKELGLARNKFQGAEFNFTSLKGRISKLHEEVAQKSNTIRAIRKQIDFVEALSLADVPQLEYLEINGTQYQAKNNAHVFDEKGQLVLYVKNNGETDTAKSTA